MRYPIGVETFEEIINRDYVYVDKTDLVYKLVDNHVCFLSRPRRFGKSLLISTLDSYFKGRKELFKGLRINEYKLDFPNGEVRKSFLSSIPYDADKNLKSESYETHFTFLFYLINRILGAYTTYIEKENSNGRADIIIETDDYVYI